MKAAVYDALSADDKQRSDFLRACLLKLGLHVNQHEQALPSLSAIHFSSMKANAVKNVLAELQKEGSIDIVDGREMIKGAVDTFDIQRSSDAWSMSNVVKVITDTVKNALDTLQDNTTDTTADNESVAAKAEEPETDDPDKIIDYEKIVKKIIAHEDQPPSAQEAPYFNHDAYFSALEAYISSDRRILYSNVHVGKHLLYGQVVTSTSTLLEKLVASCLQNLLNDTDHIQKSKSHEPSSTRHNHDSNFTTVRSRSWLKRLDFTRRFTHVLFCPSTSLATPIYCPSSLHPISRGTRCSRRRPDLRCGH